MKILMIALLATPLAWGQVSQAEIKNFNFSYSAPLGEGTADAFSYQQKTLEAGQAVHVEKVGEDFLIKLEGVENQELTFKNPPELIKNAQNIRLTAFNLNFSDKASVSVSKGTFESPEKSLELSNFSLACDRVSAEAEIMDQVLTGCIQKMALKAGGFASEGVESLEASKDLGIKNINFKVSGGKFDLTAEVKAQISGKATGNGTIKYEKATKKITVKISEVKFGILNVTSQIFEELEKQEGPNLVVSKPYVYITVK